MMNTFLAGEDQQHTNQPNDLAGSEHQLVTLTISCKLTSCNFDELTLTLGLGYRV